MSGTATAAGPPSGRWMILVTGLALLLAMMIVAHLFVGSIRLAPAEVVAALRGDLDGPTRHIVTQIRAPRTLIAATAGAMLGIAGALLQAVTRNDLAEPSLLGVSAGAVLGVVVLLQLGGVAVAPGWRLAAAAAGGLAASAAVYLLGWRGRTEPLRLILAGVLIAALLSAMSSLLLLGGGEAFGSVLRWLIGSLHARTWTDWALLWPVAIPTIVAGLACMRVANVVALSEPHPHVLGLRDDVARAVLFVVAAALTAGAVAIVGAIGFVGLVAAHIARRVVGDDAFRLIPVTLLAAATVLVAADLVATGVTIQIGLGGLTHRAMLPVGAVTALVGAPLLLALLRRDKP